jgi:metal-responsive CopG/Arc/MetJ family transcriptional regulator
MNIPSWKQYKKISVSLDMELFEKVYVMKYETGTSYSKVISDIIEGYFENEKDKEISETL